MKMRSIALVYVNVNVNVIMSFLSCAALFPARLNSIDVKQLPQSVLHQWQAIIAKVHIVAIDENGG